MSMPISTTTTEEWREEASDQRRRARNRLAQRNYRKSIKARLRELESLRAQQSHVGGAGAEEPHSHLRMEDDGIKPRETECRSVEEALPLLVTHSHPEQPEHGHGPGRRKLDTNFGGPTQSPLDKSPDFQLGWSDASTLTPSLPRCLTLDDGLDGPLQSDLIKHGSTVSPRPWDEPSNGVQNGHFSGQTPLHQAAVSGHTNVMRLLLAHGASITAVDENGQTALHLAAKYGHESTVRYVLDQGISVDSRDYLGNTALHLAAANGLEAIVEALLCAGACVDSMTHSY